jgi:hypothetical protein
MPKSRHIAASLIATLLLSACGKPESKTLLYYQQHLDEAHEKVARCKAGTDTDAECQNAGSALLLQTKPTPIGTYHN